MRNFSQVVSDESHVGKITCALSQVERTLQVDACGGMFPFDNVDIPQIATEPCNLRDACALFIDGQSRVHVRESIAEMTNTCGNHA
jgi:hypothetical protein